jgi:hypothetical protein
MVVFLSLKGKKMRKMYLLAVVAIMFMGACNSPASRLKGEWKVADVQTQFGKTKLPPEVVAHIVDEQKKITFRIVNDSVLVLMLDNNTHEAHWKLDKDKTIRYSFTSQPAMVNKLGKWDGEKIISESKTPLGELIVTYEKK